MNQLSLFNSPLDKLKDANDRLSIGCKELGKQLRDIGINQAVDNANKKVNSWSDKAYDFLVNYIRSHKHFMVEDVRESAKGIIPEAPSKRAWGGIILRASRQGLVRNIGIRKVTNPNAHCANAAVWERI